MAQRTLIVGDVHGCADELDALLDRVGPTRVVLVGDVFTKGPAPARVWAQIRDGAFDSVMGNHDLRLLEIVAGERRRDQEGQDCVRDLDRADAAWRVWIAGLPLFAEVLGFTVVHAGLHPSGDLDQTTRKMAVAMRRFPMDDPKAPFWWQQYRGDRRVVFGHDAVRGLIRVDRAGAPWIVGLDTGCVYGGRLSGYLVEEDAVVHVEARQSYCPVETPPSGPTLPLDGPMPSPAALSSSSGGKS